MNLFSAANRPQMMEQLKTQSFDLLVVGGGITGAGIALDAAARGMKVALVEKGDFASGTSSKSTKLIHGGLRYLKQLEFALVSEVGRERAILHRLAPHLVQPEKMLLPIIRGGTYGKFAASFGLWFYDVLAGVKGDDRRRMMNKAQTLDAEPLLREEGLIGSGIYAEYRTDDARLTIEVVKAAVRHGAICLNYAEVVDFQYVNGKVRGAVCKDNETGGTFGIEATYTVSAAGPWVDELRKKDQSLTGKRLFLSKGVHVVVAKERLPLRHAVYFDIGDGRMMFAIPRHRATYLGTTDTAYKGKPEDVCDEPADIEYILAGANRMFPSAKLTTSDVESTWAGLRPLIYEEGKSAGEMSRKDEVFVSPSGLISIAGGKLTGYRKMAEKVTDRVVSLLRASGIKFDRCTTDRIPLAADPFPNKAEVDAFKKSLLQHLAALHLPAFYVPYLVENYGKAALPIVEHAKRSGLKGDAPLLAAERTYCFDNEMIVKEDDFLERRTGRRLFMRIV
jgi:glycerol-3-phosphate dehydrogenase